MAEVIDFEYEYIHRKALVYHYEHNVDFDLCFEAQCIIYHSKMAHTMAEKEGPVVEYNDNKRVIQCPTIDMNYLYEDSQNE